MVLGYLAVMSDFRAFNRSLGVLALLAACGVSATAKAQSDEQRAAARSLATEGITAFNEGRFKDSADLFARAESLLHAPPHLLYLARSYAKLGQVVRARETYMRIVKEQLPSNAPPQFRDAQEKAQEELRGVEPRIAKLTVQVNGGADAKDLQVTIDGRPLPAVMIGLPQPVDPGEHRVEGIATGKRAKPQTVTLRDGERSSITLQLESDPNAVAPTPVAQPGEGTPGAEGQTGPTAARPVNVGTPPPPVAPEAVRSSGPRSYAVGGIGIGTGLIGAGAVVFGVISLSDSSSKRNEADKACNPGPDGKCAANTRALVDKLDADANSARTRGFVGLVAGGVLVAGGITMVVYGFGSSETRTGRLTPIIGPRYLGVRGTF